MGGGGGWSAEWEFLWTTSCFSCQGQPEDLWTVNASRLALNRRSWNGRPTPIGLFGHRLPIRRCSALGVPESGTLFLALRTALHGTHCTGHALKHDVDIACIYLGGALACFDTECVVQNPRLVSKPERAKRSAHMVKPPITRHKTQQRYPFCLVLFDSVIFCLVICNFGIFWPYFVWTGVCILRCFHRFRRAVKQTVATSCSFQSSISYDFLYISRCLRGSCGLPLGTTSSS